MPTGVTDLANELVCIIASYAPVADVVHLLSTCRALHAFMAEEAIWRYYCVLYGVQDPAQLGGHTFFQVYSGLLHTYGPLLGLWASDEPFIGGVSEFRVDAEHKVIIGEEWWMGHNRRTSRGLLDLPQYTPFVSISLPSPRESFEGHPSRPDSPKFAWRLLTAGNKTGPLADILGPQVEPDGSPSASFHLLSPTDANTFIVYYREYSSLPDFPGWPETWYDSRRQLPRFPLEPSPTTRTIRPDIAEGWLDYRESKTPTVYTAKGPRIRPKAICIKRHGVDTPYDLLDVRSFPDNYQMGFMLNKQVKLSPSGIGFNTERLYPLRSDRRVGQDPTDELWDPASLEGLWFGDYDVNGTEILWLYYVANEKVVRALKITGDYNVPRGATSWIMHVDRTLNAKEISELDDRVECYRGLPMNRVYQSQGLVSAFGYLERDRDDVINYAVIIGPDEIGMEWCEIRPNIITKYRRHLPRDFASEET
ncbi:hypothetical protein BDY19DRAFT_996138 [Irpex rosettiformis]|uniref:Uncharacterized protein n=1 Tax=Irpex rosettiformis TaxID=378272 RepID=A0ACB8TWB8_9APHY|nr:hypothetical protein BDY19DRAFT_996138 [Irpex rosettiformis]